MPKYQKAHKNKYAKKTASDRNRDDVAHFSQRSRNYYQHKLPGKGRKFGVRP